MSLVYSTETGRVCPKCGSPVSKCKCSNKKKKTKGGGLPEVKKDGIIRLLRQTKGRKGKGVVLVTGIDPGEYNIKDIAKKLKVKCGTGGSVKGDVIEIQGDSRDIIKSELEQLGFSVKLSGG